MFNVWMFDKLFFVVRFITLILVDNDFYRKNKIFKFLILSSCSYNMYITNNYHITNIRSRINFLKFKHIFFFCYKINII